MKIRLLLTILAAALFSPLQAQEYIDIIRMGKGKRVIGTIEQRTDSTVVIRATLNKLTLPYTYQLSQIKSIRRKRLYNTSQFYLDVSMAWAIDRYSSGDFGKYEIASVYGYRVDPTLFAGIGVALNYYSYRQAPSRVSVPVFGDLKFFLIKNRRASPFVEVRAGAFMIGGYGLYFGGAAGLVFDDVFVKIGYDFQQLPYGKFRWLVMDGDQRARTTTVKVRQHLKISLGVKF